MPRGMTPISPGARLENAELGVEHEAAQLGHEQQFAVGGVEEAVGHALVGRIDVDCDAGVHAEVAVAGQGDEAVDEVGRLRGQRQRVPAQLVGGRFDLVEGARCEPCRWRCARTACA